MKTRILALFVATAGFASAASYTLFSSTQFTQGSVLNFNVQKFNSNLGTLTGVTVVVTAGNLQGSPSVKNTDTVTVGVNSISDTFFTQTADEDLDGLSPTLGYQSTSRARSNVLTTPTKTSVTIDPGNTQTFDINAGQSMAISGLASQDIDSAYFGAYQSSGGTGNVTFQAQNVFSITTTGASYEVNSTSVGVNTTYAITYTYTAIPEPSAALIGGLGFLCLLRRRR